MKTLTSEEIKHFVLNGIINLLHFNKDKDSRFVYSDVYYDQFFPCGYPSYIYQDIILTKNPIFPLHLFEVKSGSILKDGVYPLYIVPDFFNSFLSHYQSYPALDNLLLEWILLATEFEQSFVLVDGSVVDAKLNSSLQEKLASKGRDIMVEIIHTNPEVIQNNLLELAFWKNIDTTKYTKKNSLMKSFLACLCSKFESIDDVIALKNIYEQSRYYHYNSFTYDLWHFNLNFFAKPYSLKNCPYSINDMSYQKTVEQIKSLNELIFYDFSETKHIFVYFFEHSTNKKVVDICREILEFNNALSFDIPPIVLVEKKQTYYHNHVSLSFKHLKHLANNDEFLAITVCLLMKRYFINELKLDVGLICKNAEDTTIFSISDTNQNTVDNFAKTILNLYEFAFNSVFLQGQMLKQLSKTSFGSRLEHETNLFYYNEFASNYTTWKFKDHLDKSMTSSSKKSSSKVKI